MFHASKRPGGEQGAMAIVVALSMTVLVVCAGLVTDFGLARVDRTANKSAADAAVSGGLLSLYDNDERKPWRAVCAAIEYLKINNDDFSGTTGTYTTAVPTAVTDPCGNTASPLLNSVCIPGNRSTWARWTGASADGRTTAEIVNGYTMPDPNFPEDSALGGDTGGAVDDGCDQMAVIIRETRPPGLGGVASDDGLVTQVRSVGRATVDVAKAVAPAMFLLERTACSVLSAGSNNTYIRIKGVETSPGLIHSDSLGNNTAAGCGSGKVFEGKFAAHIVAEKATTGGASGLITTVALSGAPGSIAANAYDSLTNVVAQGGSVAGADVIGRSVVDKRYAAGVRAAILATPFYTPMPAGYTLYAGCGGGSSGTATHVYVNCPSGLSCGACNFPSATHIIVNGPVSVGNTGSARMPVAQRVYLRSGLDVNSTFSMNDNSGTSCATSSTRAQLVISSGAFTGGSPNLRLCSTSVLMADGYASTACPIPSAPYPALPAAPANNACNGYLNFGGTPIIEWTAPNAVSTTSTAAQQFQLEDLALWTESSGLNSTTTRYKVGGGSGSVKFAGVFFIPNANPFELGGQSNADITLDAQFITRRLNASGQGTITLTPDPRNSVTVPLPPSFGLVR